MRRLIREGNPPSGQLASPVPQYWNPEIEEFEDVIGKHGAPYATLVGPNGHPISNTNALPVSDSAVAQALAQLATEGKLEEARALLATIAGTDFATQTTLAQVLSRLDDIEQRFDTGDAKVQLKGQLVESVRRATDHLIVPGGETREILTDVPIGKAESWSFSCLLPTANVTTGEFSLLMSLSNTAGQYTSIVHALAIGVDVTPDLDLFRIPSSNHLACILSDKPYTKPVANFVRIELRNHSARDIHVRHSRVALLVGGVMSNE